MLTTQPSLYFTDCPTPIIRPICTADNEKRTVVVDLIILNDPQELITNFVVKSTDNEDKKIINKQHTITNVPKDCNDFTVTVEANDGANFNIQPATCDSKLKCEICSKYPALFRQFNYNIEPVIQLITNTIL